GYWAGGSGSTHRGAYWTPTPPSTPLVARDTYFRGRDRACGPCRARERYVRATARPSRPPARHAPNGQTGMCRACGARSCKVAPARSLQRWPDDLVEPSSGQPQGLWVADLAAATPHEAVQASTSSSGSAARSSGDRRTALRRRFGAPARRSLSTNEARKRLCPGSSPGPITSAQRVPEGTYEGDEGPA